MQFVLNIILNKYNKMFTNVIKENFKKCDNVNKYYQFKIWLLEYVEGRYYFKTVSERISSTKHTVKEVISLKPVDPKHSSLYFTFTVGNFGENEIYWRCIPAPPNKDPNNKDLISFLISSLLNKADVPPVRVHKFGSKGYNIEINGVSRMFSSKNQMLKSCTPELAKLIRSPWDNCERHALAACILKYGKSINNFNEFIRGVVTEKVKNFVAGQEVDRMTKNEVLLMIKDYYNFNDQYILYKF